MIIFLLWYFVWQWENLCRGKKILAHIDGFKFKKLMYLGDASEYGHIFYDGVDGIMFHMRGLWHYYSHVEDALTLLHLRAAYQYGIWDWKGIFISWCGLCGDLDPRKDVAEAIKRARRHYESTSPYKISDTGEKYKNPDYHPQARDVCSAFLWVRNFKVHGDAKWAEYWSDRDFENYFRGPKFK